MPSKDITYCTNYDCKNNDCERNVSHLEVGEVRSFCGFPECKFYKEFLAELRRKDEEEAIAEAKRDMYKLDDNEGTLKYKGWT